jgi:hypothetical protein
MENDLETPYARRPGRPVPRARLRDGTGEYPVRARNDAVVRDHAVKQGVGATGGSDARSCRHGFQQCAALRLIGPLQRIQLVGPRGQRSKRPLSGEIRRLVERPVFGSAFFMLTDVSYGPLFPKFPLPQRRPTDTMTMHAHGERRPPVLAVRWRQQGDHFDMAPARVRSPGAIAV